MLQYKNLKKGYEMKLKFVLVPLVVLGFAVGSYADCSKDEILKLIDKGFTKTEINGICGKSESKKEKSKWITPSNKTCMSYGGKIKNGVCTATWSMAKDICSASSGRLPSFYELKKVIVDCGGTIDDANNNKKDSVYQDCYKKKGFSTSYWSSTTLTDYISLAWGVYFYAGDTYNNNKSTFHNVRCVRAGQ